MHINPARVRSSLMALVGLVSSGAMNWRDEDGQTMAEYAILVAVIALVVIIAAVFFGGKVATLFSSLGNNL